MEHGESENCRKKPGKLEVGEVHSAFWLLAKGTGFFPLRRGLMFIAKTPQKKSQVPISTGISCL